MRKIVSTCFAVALFAMTACSHTCNESSGASVVAGYSYTNCPGSAVVVPACITCLETHCPDDLSSVNTACSAYFSCVCPSGADAAACPKAPRPVSAGGDPGDPCGVALFGANPRARSGLSGCAATNCSKCAAGR